MARKSRRSSSRKMRRTHKRRTHHRRSHRRSTHRRSTHRRRGGMAPVNYHLSGSWPSRMSLGQGADYFKYHEGQHGGGLGMGPYPSAVLSPGLPQELRGPAHIGGIDKAIADVKGLCDPPACPGTTTGGRRKSRRGRKSHHRRRSHRTRRNRSYGGSRRRNRNNTMNAAVTNMVVNEQVAVVGGRNRRNRRRRGGSLGYAPFPSPGMLLSSPKQYAQAGLNPEWKTDVAFTDAKIREMQ